MSPGGVRGGAHLFSDYFSATLLLSTIAGCCFVLPMGPCKLAIYPLLALIPVLVRRDYDMLWPAVLMAVVVMVFYVGILYSVFLTFNGRDSLPLVFYYAPLGEIVTPWPGAADWRLTARLSLALILLPVDLLIVFLRERRRMKELWDLGAVFAANAVAQVLFPLSWGAKVAGTFNYRHLSTPTHEVFCFVMLWFTIVVKYLVLNYVYSPRTFFVRQEPSWP